MDHNTKTMLVISSLLVMLGIIINVYQWAYRQAEHGEGGSNFLCLVLLILQYIVYLVYILPPPG